ncbi:hypothetical protein Dsin_024221 [Dipteronia sinensis]|uniref:Uncharacterized protein n=1 Tax=Dipteronia sinensis TaxID=43782 RepID=A0AAD9ZTS0_9ROSI|nr:hypothetical protein Dsin_024221 [Dipteronia sinensis]
MQVSDYEKEIDILKSVTKEEYLASLRRKSSGSQGVYPSIEELQAGTIIMGDERLELGGCNDTIVVSHGTVIVLCRHRAITVPCDTTMFEYVVSLVGRQMPEELEKALLTSIATLQSSPIGIIIFSFQGQSHHQQLISGYRILFFHNNFV